MFAVVADILLRKLTRHLAGGGEVRAFADDTAVLTKDIREFGPILDIFREYEQISNLGLNFKKTVIIPLFEKVIELARDFTIGLLPTTKEMTFRLCFPLLGDSAGPRS